MREKIMHRWYRLNSETCWWKSPYYPPEFERNTSRKKEYGNSNVLFNRQMYTEILMVVIYVSTTQSIGDGIVEKHNGAYCRRVWIIVIYVTAPGIHRAKISGNIVVSMQYHGFAVLAQAGTSCNGYFFSSGFKFKKNHACSCK